MYILNIIIEEQIVYYRNEATLKNYGNALKVIMQQVKSNYSWLSNIPTISIAVLSCFIACMDYGVNKASCRSKRETIDFLMNSDHKQLAHENCF